MQRLILRLGSEPQAPVQWLVFSDSEQEIIASGELPSAFELASLKERADSSTVIALAPSSDILLSSVSLPPNANRKILGAIPYMLEEDICGDLSQHFVALGARQGTEQHIAVVAKTTLTMWQSALKDAGIFCQQIIPDTLALPLKDGHISILQLGQELLVRVDESHAMQGEVDWLLPLVLKEAKEKQVSISCYSDIEGLPNDTVATDAAGPECVFDYTELPLLLMLKNIDGNSLNLCQGAYAVKREGNPHWQKWKVAAILAGLALSANIVTKTLELNEIKSQRAALSTQIRATIAEGFPDIGTVRQPRRAIEREMRRIEQSGGSVGMLAVLTQLSEAFASSGVSPQTLRFDASRTELRMQSVANNFESLERFRRDIQALGFEVDQGAINNQGDQVVGVIVVKG